jgi:hypothetical protein
MSRRDQIRLTEEELATFLAKSQTIIIVSIIGWHPPIPMWWASDWRSVLMTFTKPEDRNIARDPRVSLLVSQAARSRS